MDRTMYDHIYTVDLNQPLKRFDVGDILASGDEKANCFEITVCRGEENVDLSGMAVYGYFIRPNDETFKVDGTVEGNVVRLEPSKSCYVFDGAFSLAVKLAGSGTTQTIAVLDGRIVRTTSENIVDGERVFYSLEDMLAQIEVMEVASRNANTAAENANTATERANLAAYAIENITASTTTTDAGTDAVVEVEDENGAKRFRFSIPRGEKGEKGDPGAIENVTVNSIEGLPEALSERLPVSGYPTGKFLATDSAGNVVTRDCTKETVGLSNVDDVKQYSASNPPPYPVTSVNGMTGAVTIDLPEFDGDADSLGGTAASVYKDFMTKKSYTVTASSTFVNTGSITADSLGGVLRVGGYLQTKKQHAASATDTICTISGVKVSGMAYATVVDHDGTGKAFNVLLLTENNSTRVQLESAGYALSSGAWLNFTVYGIIA